MANNPKAAENLKPAKKGEVRNPYGRPKKLVGQILDDLKGAGYKPVSKEQVAATYQTLLIIPEEQLKTLAMDKDQPMLNRILAKAILGGRGFENIEKMLDRAQGRATNSTDVTSGGEKIVIPIYGGLSVGDKDLPNDNSNKKNLQSKEKN